MLSLQQFHNAVLNDLGKPLNTHQEQAINAAVSDCLFLVAGPGSGKTTALALRVLKCVFVDDVDPGTILATTFTRKAAKELRSRILSWGDQLRHSFLNRTRSNHTRAVLARLDLNAIVIGTLDSIAQTLLSENRAPGTQPPVVIEDFVSNGLMLREGLFPGHRHLDNDLHAYISALRGSSYGLNAPQLSRVLRTIRERCLHDSVDEHNYRNTQNPNCVVCSQHPHNGISTACDAIADYSNVLQREGVLDFAALEQEFLSRLQARTGPLNQHVNTFVIVVVDEYQDTNLLQEQIYFELGERVVANNGGISVVGDDDQSLFRFRGATVDLFQDFPNRLHQHLSHRLANPPATPPRRIFLTENYRSTGRIVDFVNTYVQLDVGYQAVRVAGKPPIIQRRQVQHNPRVLGMFRDDVDTLGSDLSEFLYDVFQGRGRNIPRVGLIRKSPGGSIGDCALLCHSPAEVKESYQQNTGTIRRRDRLPFHLREHLGSMNPPIRVFNPHGQHLASVPDVERLCGLILLCIDPNKQYQDAIQRLPQEAADTMNRWRLVADDYMRRNPVPRIPPRRGANTLSAFVQSWQQQHVQGQIRASRRRGNWPDEIHLVDLVYKLVTWIPNMQDDIEGLVYLEVITRTILQSALFTAPFRGHIVFNTARNRRSSVHRVLWSVFVPIAMGAVEVDEDLLDTLPTDRLNILSIHQSKGLQFPMVIVDVGSDFRTNNQQQAFMRFPRNGDLTHNLEDELRQFSALNPPNRSAIDRAFDDLIRLYYVAFSRAEDVLLLIGLSSVRERIMHVATGWDRTQQWHWGRNLPNLIHI
jgi:DNA helicase-2/ATP-dependent DNA helicase PcrA